MGYGSKLSDRKMDDFPTKHDHFLLVIGTIILSQTQLKKLQFQRFMTNTNLPTLNPLKTLLNHHEVLIKSHYLLVIQHSLIATENNPFKVDLPVMNGDVP